MTTHNQETAIFANGCFWCTEAIFQKLKGVSTVIPGFIGGSTENPTYKEVCTGTTGYAEALQISFDPEQVSFRELLEVFFATHDPTSLNRQGNDIGTQYRSEIFYTNANQKMQAEGFIKIINEQNFFGTPVVTQLSAATTFYPAEEYHFDYFNNNPENSYCSAVIAPKVAKFEQFFEVYLRK
ncbi:MAG TPA: peptide-methionine (S)-S-oxide reductase MsrA [Flavobacterium sp.]|nr:peptide-methionine (S)-S-oxide reductase MsrA [Flavobacterium sp.]